MGCATSTEARRDMVWVGADADSRGRRSFSLPSVDRQRLRLRAVSVLGTLGLAAGSSARHSGPGAACSRHATATLSSSVEEMMMKSDNDRDHDVVVLLGDDDDDAAAKRLPALMTKLRTPTLTPPNEPEVINAWELMAGLEDDAAPPTPTYMCLPLDEAPPPELVLDDAQPLPQWMAQAADVDTPVVSLDFDPEVLSGFREALVGTPEPEPEPEPAVVSSAEHETETPIKEQEDRKDRKDADACDTPMSPAATTGGDGMPELSGLVRSRIMAFQEKIERRRSKGGRDAKASPPGGQRKAVVYHTSLRGVRKTFVDCCAVRSILRSYGVRLDERDVSMHAVFKAELADLLGPGFAGPALPRVFVDGQYLGGAEDVHFLHEAGELGRVLMEGCDAAPTSRKVGGCGYMEACAGCGDVRFVPCETCYGSCKVFVVEDDDHGVGEFRRCPDCNENGLVRCPVCCC